MVQPLRTLARSPSFLICLAVWQFIYLAVLWLGQSGHEAPTPAPRPFPRYLIPIRAPPWVERRPSAITVIHEVFDASKRASRGPDSPPSPPFERPPGYEPVYPLHFASPALHWYNRPKRPCTFHHESGNLLLRPDAETDFWQRPGRSADQGHFLHLEVPQNVGERIVVSARVTLVPQHTGDKVGVMVRRGASAWVTGALEREGSQMQLSSVVTNLARSDRAPAVCTGCSAASLRIAISGDDVVVQASTSPDEEEDSWRTLRVAQLHDEGEEKGKTVVSVGAFASSPGSRSGTVAALSYLSIIRSPHSQ